MKQAGFTLIELLVVVAILSVLASIGFPQYARYKERAYDSGARSDLRNAAGGEEAYFINNSAYLSCVDNSCLETTPGLPGLRALSATVSLTVVDRGNSYIASTSASAGSGKLFTYNSEEGEIN